MASLARFKAPLKILETGGGLERIVDCYTPQFIQGREEAEAINGHWDVLYETSLPRNPFLSRQWSDTCLQHQGGTPFLVALWSGKQLVGLAPLRIERKWGFRVLRFAADGRSDYLGFLCHPDHPGVERELLQALEAHSGLWDLAVLRHLSEPFSQLQELGPGRLCAQRVEGTVAPHLHWDGDWKDLCANGPGWFRQSPRKVRKFLREGGTVERFEGEDAARRVGEVSEVEAASWKGRDGVARFQPGRGQELLRDALASLGERGEMELWIARREGRAVAFQVNFTPPGPAGAPPNWVGYYQGAYREDESRYAPGVVLMFEAIRHHWDNGCREWDYMAGDEGYKSERTNAVRTLWYRAFYPKTLRGHAAYSLMIAPRWQLKGSAPAQAAFRQWNALRSRLLNHTSPVSAGASAVAGAGR